MSIHKQGTRLPRYSEVTGDKLNTNVKRAIKAVVTAQANLEKAQQRLRDYKNTHTASLDERLVAGLKGRRIPLRRLPTTNHLRRSSS